MKIILVLALVSSLAQAAEPVSPAVTAARFYASSKVINTLMSTQSRFARNGVEYGLKSDLLAMYHNSRCYLDFNMAAKELAAAAAALPAMASEDAASKALLALADHELALAEKTGAEATAMIEASREKIEQNEKAVPFGKKTGLPSAWMMIDMLKPELLPIAQARAAAAGKR